MRAQRRPRRPHGDPWREPTLEWVPAGNYASSQLGPGSTIRWLKPGTAMPALGISDEHARLMAACLSRAH